MKDIFADILSRNRDDAEFMVAIPLRVISNLLDSHTRSIELILPLGSLAVGGATLELQGKSVPCAIFFLQPKEHGMMPRESSGDSRNGVTTGT